jgi:hypothetical protein
MPLIQAVPNFHALTSVTFLTFKGQLGALLITFFSWHSACHLKGQESPETDHHM